MFLGQFEHTIDEKGRLTIPARFRDLLVAEGAYIMQGFESNLMVLTTANFLALSERVNQLNVTDGNARLLRRMLFSSAQALEFDKAGRVLIPAFLREAARLNGEAMVVGNGDYFEIWSKPLWAEQQALLQDPDTTAQRFAALDLTLRP